MTSDDGPAEQAELPPPLPAAAMPDPARPAPPLPAPATDAPATPHPSPYANVPAEETTMLPSPTADAPAVEPATPHAVCEFRDVERRYRDGDDDVFALAGVTLTIRAGEFVAIMGPSGSGKSTLLNLAGGLDVATAGQVVVGGHDLAGMNATELAALRRTTVGYVFQRLNLIPSLTAVENVMLPLELSGLAARKARAAARAALAEAGVEPLADRFPDDLSGGQQQRVAIARALVGDRRVLLADEPTGALDTVTGEAVLELLATRARQGIAVVLVTHEPRFASFADRIVNLRDGRVVDAPRGIDPLGNSSIGNGAAR